MHGGVQWINTVVRHWLLITEPEVPEIASVTFAWPGDIVQKLLLPDKGACQGNDINASTVSIGSGRAVV